VVSRSHEAPHAFERCTGAATAPLPRGYRPRHPETTTLYRVIADHVETMLQDARDRSAHGFGLPRHVERSFHRYLDCGVLARGFARVACPSCRYEVLVPFSCKTRGICSSCDGRRMADTAAHLVDRVLPPLPGYRQWTLSFPRWLRIRLLRDPTLVSELLSAFVRIVFAYHRRRARDLGVPVGDTGAVTAVQRFGSFVNANLHFHTLVPDGVWQERPDGSVAFHHLPRPTDDAIEGLAARIVRRTARILARRDPDLADDDEPDALALAHAEAVQTPLALPEPDPEPRRSRQRLCAFVDGFSLHANTAVAPADRAALERLARYILRPAIAADRVALRPDGPVEYRFRRPDPSGRTAWVTDGPTLCRRLATLIPPRRSHTVRYHGVFSAAHRLRSRVVPDPPSADADAGPRPPTAAAMLARRLDWAALLQRAFGPEVTACPRCGDALRVLAFITDPDLSARILHHLALPATVPPIAPARGPPLEDHLDLAFADF
jgi:hypothetical protein